MQFLEKYISIIEQELIKNKFEENPQELYQPLNYFINIGGKRIRPIMTLMACELFQGDINQAINSALALEYFHNFSLIHDDVMDKATLRRSQMTIHEKYNLNTAILSGDALLIKSYQFFENLPSEMFKKIILLFSKTALEVCEGQQLDINFENQKQVSFEDYINMITLKTAVLGAAALKIGAIIANTEQKKIELIYNFGINIGIAYQIMDDYLDVFGDSDSVGKKNSGDIYENKKTILYILAIQKCSDKDLKELLYWYSLKTENIDKVFAIKQIFEKYNIDKEVILLIEKYTNKAYECLDSLNEKQQNIEKFYKLTDFLLNRKK